MYNKKNFRTRNAGFNTARQNAFNRNNNNASAKTKLPRDISAIIHTLSTNKDIRSYTAKALIKLHTAKGDILEGQKVFVEFNNGVYSVITYPITEGNVKSLPLRNDFSYSTREFYLALQASVSILSAVIVNNFTNYYKTYKPAFNLDDKELDKVFNSLVQSISSNEIAFQNRLLESDAEEVETETETENAE